MKGKASKYIRLILGIILMLIGIGFMVVPFIPIGFIIIFVAVLFLVPYIPPLKKLATYLKKKDGKGILDKTEKKIQNIQDKIDGNSTEKNKEEGKEKNKRK